MTHPRIALFFFIILTIILSSCTPIKSKIIEGRWRSFSEQTIQGNPVILTLEFFSDGSFSPRTNGVCPPEPYLCVEKWRFISDDKLVLTAGKRELIYTAQIKQNAILLTQTTDPSLLKSWLLFRCYSNDTGITIAC